MSKNIGFLSGRKGLDKNLFTELGKAALAQGSPSIDDLTKLKDEYLLGKSSVYGTTTFYDFLRPENKGKKVYICNGSACMTAGTQANVKNKLLSVYEENEIGEMCCLGRCHENSAFHVDKVNYSGHDIDHVLDIKAQTFKTQEQYAVDHIGTPVLTKAYSELAEYYKIFDKALSIGQDAVLAEIKSSVVRGRGGAGFPMSL
jgi:NADH-quinone oxidoreductase subunit F